MSIDEEGGLGLDDFLNFDPDSERSHGGGGLFLGSWKKARQIDVWLHLRSKIRAVWTHQIPIEGEYEEKDEASGEKTGVTKPKLFWPRFVSPDAVNIHASQYFRTDKTGPLREQLSMVPGSNGKKLVGGSEATAYMRDPFLILREYLYHAVGAGLIAPDAIVFEWVDFKNNNELIRWTAGELSRRTKRGFNNRSHSLDTKLEYIFVVVDNAAPEKGPRIARETKLVGEKMRATIKREMESRGDEGNPFLSPYCFRWKFDPDAKNAMDTYDVFRVDRNQCTGEIWQAIGGEPDPDANESWDVVEPPDTSSYGAVQDGDFEKIRQAFESAAQIDLPLDAIFAEDYTERRALVTGAFLGSSARSAPRAPRTQTQPTPEPAPNPGAVRRPAPTAQPGGAKLGASSGGAPARPATSSTASPASTTSTTSSGPQPRRKKVATAEPAPAPAPELEVERVPCDTCGHMMLPTEAKCPKCGTEYEIDDPSEPAPASSAGGATSAPAKAASSSTASPASATGGAKRPKPLTDEEAAAVAEMASKKCIGCGSEKLRLVDADGGGSKLVCDNCGCDQGDDIPF